MQRSSWSNWMWLYKLLYKWSQWVIVVLWCHFVEWPSGTETFDLFASIWTYCSSCQKGNLPYLRVSKIAKIVDFAHSIRIMKNKTGYLFDYYLTLIWSPIIPISTRFQKKLHLVGPGKNSNNLNSQLFWQLFDDSNYFNDCLTTFWRFLGYCLWFPNYFMKLHDNFHDIYSVLLLVPLICSQSRVLLCNSSQHICTFCESQFCFAWHETAYQYRVCHVLRHVWNGIHKRALSLFHALNDALL